MDDTRVFWRSRRGMLELDLFLVPFATDRYPTLDRRLKTAFADLLELDDWVILDWVQEKTAVDGEFVDIVACIRSFNAARD